MKNKIIAVCMGMFSMMIAEHVDAACKMSFPSKIDSYTINVNIALGKIDVRSTDAIGKILARASGHFNDESIDHSVKCTDNSFLRGRLTRDLPLSTIVVRTYHIRTVTGAETGLGIRMSMEGNTRDLNIPGERRIERVKGKDTVRVLGSGDLIVEIIKIKNEIIAGPIPSGSYAWVRYEGIDRDRLSLNISGDIRLLTPTCSWIGSGNRTVTLSSVYKSAFKGVGTTAGEQAFELNLNCNGGPGGTVNLVFDYTPSPTNPEVILNSLALSGKASGVDLQLISTYQSMNKIIKKGSKIQVATLGPNQEQNINLPFLARYYQSEQNITAGEVSGQATITFEYQ